MIVDEDPEVVADVQLRASTERDSSRSRPNQFVLGSWRPDGPVAQWNCRRPGCHTLVDVTQDGVDRLEQANAMLVRLGQRKILDTEVLWCPACSKAFFDARSDRLRVKVDRLAELIRKLKDSTTPRSEHLLLTDIEKCHHPDIRGLLDAIDARRAKPGERSKRERRDAF